MVCLALVCVCVCVCVRVSLTVCSSLCICVVVPLVSLHHCQPFCGLLSASQCLSIRLFVFPFGWHCPKPLLPSPGGEQPTIPQILWSVEQYSPAQQRPGPFLEVLDLDDKLYGLPPSLPPSLPPLSRVLGTTALPGRPGHTAPPGDRKSTRLNSSHQI